MHFSKLETEGRQNKYLPYCFSGSLENIKTKKFPKMLFIPKNVYL